jgi:proliferating cell nuclear antigen PCNA
MSINVVIPDSKHFRSVISSVSEFVDDINLNFNDDGMYAQAMDSSHICLSHILIGCEYFESYNISEPTSIGINIKLLTKILKCMDNGKITIQTSPSSDKMNIIFEGENRSEYQLNMIDIETDDMQIPETEYNYQLHTNYKYITTIIKKISTLAGSDIEFEVENGIFKLKSKDEDEQIHSAFTVAEAQNNDENEDDENEDENNNTGETRFTIIDNENILMKYSFRYFQGFFKVSNISNNVSINFMDEVPLCVEYKFEHGHVQHFLAPKIEDDDEY